MIPSNTSIDWRRRTNSIYVVAEKILAADESLRHSWQVAGTTGYDFLKQDQRVVSSIQPAEQPLTQLYQKMGKLILTRFEDLAYEKKKLILESSLASELQMLAQPIRRDRNRRIAVGATSRLRGFANKRSAKIIACFPTYRSYITSADEIDQIDRDWITARGAAGRASENPSISPRDLPVSSSKTVLQPAGDCRKIPAN